MAALWLLGLGLLFSAAACGAKDDVAMIRKLIQKGAKSAEEKRISDLMSLTAGGFLAQPGSYDTRTVKSILLGAFAHYGTFKIHFPRPAVDLQPDGSSANAEVYFLIVRQNQSIPGLKELYDDPRRWLETVGEKADLYQLRLELKKTNGDWRVQQARLEGFKGTGF